MFFSRKRQLLENAESAVLSAQSALEKTIEWMRVDAALIRYALRNGGDPALTVPTDDVRLLLSDQMAALLVANENLMKLLGKKHFFNIRPFSAPLGLENFDEFKAKVWGLIWPDKRYPRYEELTPEQRYFAFGPGGSPNKP
ncbi:MAG: hypothetical protein SFV21_02955 [Rhodospirillaceae bacterium]|nr:hypothetical protein [Rhodospirillaceae bacterium]